MSYLPELTGPQILNNARQIRQRAVQLLAEASALQQLQNLLRKQARQQRPQQGSN